MCWLSAETLGIYTAHEIDGQSLIIHSGISAIVILPYTENIVRLSLFSDGIEQQDTSHVVVLEPEFVSWNLEEYETYLKMDLGNNAIFINKYPVRISHSSNSEYLLSDEDGFFWNGDNKGVRFLIESNENFYGAGERAVNINHRGMWLNSYNAPWFGYGYGARDLNITIPFILSSNLYGIYFENTYPGYFDFGNSDSEILEYGITGGQFSYYFIYGDSFPEILNHYVDLTGHQSLPPRWALGFLQSRFGYENQIEAQEIVNTFRERHIPLDAIILDLYWFGWGQMGDFNWDYSAWPNPREMMAEFDSLGVKTILITEPYMLQSSENYEETYSNGYLTPNSSGEPVIIQNFWAGSAGLLDVTNPEVVDWWWNFYQVLMDEGVGGWWCDLGEPEAHPSEMVHYLGSAEKVHNIYSLIWAKMLYEKTREHYPDQRLFNLIRSGYAGMQRYSTFPWSGDVQRSFYGLRAQLPIVLGMGLSGVGYMLSDIGGFTGGSQDPELYIRWIQYGTFNPIMRPHGTGVPTEPIFFDESTESIVTDYIKLRYQLLPYNYTLAWENSITGIPLARPLVMFAHDNPVISDIDEEYFWGPAFLVAPVTESGQYTKSVYLPEGNWIDYWNEDVYSGESWINVDAPVEKIPLFIKAGSFIPMIPLIQTTKKYTGDSLIVHYYPETEGSTTTYTMYEDDGKSPDAFQLGQYELLTFNGLISSTDLIQLSCLRNGGGYPDAPTVRELIYSIHGVVNTPQNVLLNDVPLFTVSTMEEFYALDSTYYWEENRRRLWVRYQWTGTEDVLTIEGEGILYAKPEMKTLPDIMSLNFPYPNPFNSSITIQYFVFKRDVYVISIRDLLGREVKILKKDLHNKGIYTVIWDGSDKTGKTVSSGIYFIFLRGSSNEFIHRKIVLIK